MSHDAAAPVEWPRAVASLGYKPGWRFRLGGPDTAYLCAFATTPDSLHPERSRTTQHMFRLPPGPMTVAAAARWIFARLLEAELHEAGEWFAVGEFRPHFPHHADEGSPYELVDRWENPL